eukprot:scaffold66663_cov40-Phaeocystis_antarctica.AAC.1
MEGLGRALARPTQPVHRPWSPSGRRRGSEVPVPRPRAWRSAAVGRQHVASCGGNIPASIWKLSDSEQGIDCRLGAGHGEERTWNICCMAVTLEVSKLSGWLNADAPCRESKGGIIRCGAGCCPGGGSWRATAVHAACRGGDRLQIGGRAYGEERTANMRCMSVTLE